jgi:transcriptional antiterminator RfaH
MQPFKSWLVVGSHPHREDIASKNLLAQSFTVYVPKTAKRVRHARRVIDAERPLFPGYLFVEYPAAPHRLRAINGTFGVRSIISFDGTPALLTPGFVESIRAREVDGIIRSDRGLFPGQEVEVSEGPFSGLVGQIAEMREKDRIVLLLNFASRKAKLSIDARSLVPCG